MARNRYQNPRVGLIQSMDGHSAQKDIQASRGTPYRMTGRRAAPMGSVANIEHGHRI